MCRFTHYLLLLGIPSHRFKLTFNSFELFSSVSAFESLVGLIELVDVGKILIGLNKKKA